MAAEIVFRHDTASVSTLRATITKPVTVGGKVQIWHVPATAAFVDFDNTDWAHYIITLAEAVAGDYWQVATFPAAIPVGWYEVNIFNDTAITATLIGTQYGYWDGTNYHLDAANVKEWIDVVPLALSSQLVQGADTAGTTTMLADYARRTGDYSTLTQTQVSGGAYDLTNATYIAAMKSGLGTIPASGNWNVGKTGYALASTGADAVLKTSTFALAMADAVCDEPLTGHSTAGTAGKALTDIAAGVGVGPGGANTEILCQVNSVAVEGVEVWVTSDTAGANVIAGPKSSDTLGKVPFMLENASGPFYVWRQMGGYNFTNPTTITWNAGTGAYA